MSKRAQETMSIQGKQLTRRGLLGASAGVAAATAIPSVLQPSAALAAGVDWKPFFLNQTQAQTLEVLCDLILPKTGTPSATEAGVPAYIDEALSVADVDEQLEFLGGLAWLDTRSAEAQGKPFLELDAEGQFAALDEISDDKQHKKELLPGAAFFSDLKSKTLFGYYTSKTGRTQALGLPEKVQREKLKGCTHGSDGHA